MPRSLPGPGDPVPRGTGPAPSARPDLAARLEQLGAAIRSSPHNLVSPRAAAQLSTRHLPECVAFADGLPRGPATLVDVGSGGGLPGLVIALRRPDLDVHLVEATGKKADFLVATARHLGCHVTVHHGRVEDLGRGPLAARFDVATARAVAPLERLIPWILPLLRPGGTLHAIKGARWQEELAAAGPALRRAGGRVIHRPVVDPPDPAPRVVTIARRGNGPGGGPRGLVARG